MMLGVGLLGTLLVSILLANDRLGMQSRHADQRMEACVIAQEFLSAWQKQSTSAPSGFDAIPRNQSGLVAGHPGWQWRTITVNNADAAGLGGEVLALEILAPGESGEPIEHVELLVSQNYGRN